jgi:hypothetical protein
MPELTILNLGADLDPKTLSVLVVEVYDLGKENYDGGTPKC